MLYSLVILVDSFTSIWLMHAPGRLKSQGCSRYPHHGIISRRMQSQLVVLLALRYELVLT
jgi:hypothetical protein